MIYIEADNTDKIDDFTRTFSKVMPLDEDGQIYTLESTIDSGDDFIKGQMKRQNIPYYTDLLECSVLDESGEDSGYESYKGIFIDRDSGDFKVLSGRFPDKKAMIRKYGDENKPYIARKVFEAPVFKWIEENAENALDAYLMYSTALSKWRHISMLKDYYFKAMEEMPEMFSKARQMDVVTGNEGDLQEDTITQYYKSTPRGKKAKLQFYNANDELVEEQLDVLEFKATDEDKTKNPRVLRKIKDLFAEYDGLEEETAYVKVLVSDGSSDIITKDEIANGIKGDDSHAKGYNVNDEERNFKGRFRVTGEMYPVDGQGNKAPMDKLNSSHVSFELDNVAHGLKDAQVWKQAKRQLENAIEPESVYGIAFILPLDSNSPAVVGTPNDKTLAQALAHSSHDYSKMYSDGYLRLLMKKSDVYKNAGIAEEIRALGDEMDLSSLTGWSNYNPERKARKQAAIKNTGKSFYTRQFNNATEFSTFRSRVNALKNKQGE